MDCSCGHRPQDAWWQSLCPATCLQPAHLLVSRIHRELVSDNFPQRTYTGSSIRHGTWHHWSPQCPSHHLCVLELPLPGAIRRWSEAKCPHHHPALGLKVAKQRWAKTPVFCCCHCFHFKPQEQPAKCLFPADRSGTSSVTLILQKGAPPSQSHTRKWAETDKVTGSGIAAAPDLDPSVSLHRKLLPINSFNSKILFRSNYRFRGSLK